MEIEFKEAASPEEPREIRIVSGIKPEEVEDILLLAASSGRFSADALMSAEDMAWDSAYGDGSEQHSFLQAKTLISGEDKTVGFVCFGQIPHWDGNYELYGIAIDAEFRRLGIGSGLVAEMKRRIVNRNGKRVFLETGEDRTFENARLFYEANDFVCESRFHKHFVPLEGGIVYSLDVSPDETDTNYH